MIGLWLFRELMEDGFNAEKAGEIACQVARAARAEPNAPTITYVSGYFGPGGGDAVPSKDVPFPNEWQQKMFAGSNIRKIMTFNIEYTRKLLTQFTNDERSIIGEDD